MKTLLATVAVLCALGSNHASAQQQDATPAPLEYLKIIRTAVILGDTDGFFGVKESDIPKILAIGAGSRSSRSRKEMKERQEF